MIGMFPACTANRLNLAVTVNINFRNTHGIEILKIIKFADISFMMLTGNKDGRSCAKF